MVEPILQVKNLTTKLVFNGQGAHSVVDNLSFNLYLGKTLALVGESGCGKSMTALSVLRLLPMPPALPSTGEVIYKGTNLLALSDHKMRQVRWARIAMIFQDPSSCLNPVYTIGNQLLEVLFIHTQDSDEVAFDKVLKALEDVGIADPLLVLEAYPHQLSGGMKQRVMIAMALLCEPDILIADEPTTALDVTIQAQVLDLMRALQKKRGMALLLITHDMGVVAEMADDVIVMYAAQNIENGSVNTIFRERAHPYTQALFQARTMLHTPHEKLHAIAGNVPSPVEFPRGCRFHPRCPYVMEKCKQEVVRDYVVEDQSHTARCLLYDGSEESRDRVRAMSST